MGDTKVVLIMDDENHELRATESLIENLLPGWRIETMLSFVEGDPLPERVDLAILDFVMFDSMSVYDRTRLIRQKYGDACLIICHSKNMDGFLVRGLEQAGIDHAIYKNQDALEKIIEEEGLL